MRAKRAKQYRKLMLRYQQSFNFREPYQVLLDAAIIKDAAKYKMKLGSLLESTLSGQIKPMITQCCIRHLYDEEANTEAEKREKDAWIEVAKAAERRRCGHHEMEEPLSTAECMLSVVDPKGSGTNKHRYVVATQDSDVRARMREIAGVPLVYINRSVMILEPMAGKTELVREKEEKAKIRAGLKSRRSGEVPALKRKREEGEDGDAALDKQDVQEDGEAPRKKKKVKGPKGPNPLSMKKAKKDKQIPAPAKENGLKSVQQAKAGKESRAAQDTPNIVSTADEPNLQSVADGPRKRKRKRKPQAGGQEPTGDTEISAKE